MKYFLHKKICHSAECVNLFIHCKFEFGYPAANAVFKPGCLKKLTTSACGRETAP